MEAGYCEAVVLLTVPNECLHWKAGASCGYMHEAPVFCCRKIVHRKNEK